MALTASKTTSAWDERLAAWQLTTLAPHFGAAQKGGVPLFLRVVLALDPHKLERGIQVQWFPPDALRLAKEGVRQGQHRLPQVVRPLVGQVKALDFFSVWCRRALACGLLARRSQALASGV